MMNETLNHSSIIDSNYSQLVRIYPLLDRNTSLYYYTRIMKAYYQSNINVMKNLCEEIKDNEIKTIARFRLLMLEMNYSEKVVLSFFPEKISVKWKGDIFFSIGFALYKIKSFEKAQYYFYHSSLMLLKQGIEKKSSLAYQNAITMAGNVDIKQRYLSDYHACLAQAEKAEANDTCANACLNISDELYKLGATKSALRYIELSLSFLSKHSVSHPRYQSLLMKAEILCSLKRKNEALVFLEELENSENLEILEACKVIRFRHFDGSDSTVIEKRLSPPWRSKLTKYYEIKPLGDIADKLIHRLSIQKTKVDDLLQEIYPSVDFGDALNRLTTLVSRINKADSGIVLYDQTLESYELSYNSTMEEMFNVSSI